jgi:hypothetical protein
MEKHIENIIMTKSYADLNQLELRQIKEWAKNSEEFSQIKKILTTSQGLAPAEGPSADLKSNIMASFTAEHPLGANQKKKGIPAFVSPLLKIAAALVLVILLFPLIENELSTKNDSLIAQNLEEKTEESGMEAIKKERAEPAPVNKLEAPKLQNSTKELLKPLIKKKKGVQMPITAVSSDALMDQESIVTLSEIIEFQQADILLKKDISSAHSQMIQEQPQILDFLYTSF